MTRRKSVRPRAMPGEVPPASTPDRESAPFRGLALDAIERLTVPLLDRIEAALAHARPPAREAESFGPLIEETQLLLNGVLRELARLQDQVEELREIVLDRLDTAPTPGANGDDGACTDSLSRVDDPR